jgi:hypothetical protein
MPTAVAKVGTSKHQRVLQRERDTQVPPALEMLREPGARLVN